MMTLVDMAYAFPVGWVVMLGILGLLVGSFLNVVICRLPAILMARWENEACQILNRPQPVRATYNLCWPPSACASCQRPLLRRDLVPVFSWCLLRGKSRCCSQPISRHYPLVELACGILFASAGMLWLPGVRLAASLVLLSMLLTLAVIDARTLLLPDVLTIPLIWIGLLVNIDGSFVSLPDAVCGAATGYLIFSGLALLFRYLTGKEGLGGGDAKLLAAFGAWLGWASLPQLVMIAASGGFFATLLLRLFRGQATHQPVAFGPWLILAGGLLLFAWF